MNLGSLFSRHSATGTRHAKNLLFPDFHGHVAVQSDHLCDRRARAKMMQSARDRVKVELHHEQLWRLFREQQTEMVITRAGRRMFPTLDFRLTGLGPDEYFSCMVQIVSADNYRYRYELENATWTVTGTAVALDPQRCANIHPHGSTLGKIWMKEGAKFDKLKLTNHIKPCCDHIVLSSLQKYKVQLIVTKLSATQCERWVFDFPETEFIAVTCYQNPAITKLKIDYNPFAKSFRKTKRPAKQQSPLKQSTHTPIKATPTPTKAVKRPCIRLSSPPPVIRYQSPFVNPGQDITTPLTTMCVQAPSTRESFAPSPPEISKPLGRTLSQATPLTDSLLWEPVLPMIPQYLFAHPPVSNNNARLDFVGSLCRPDYLATNHSLPYNHVTERTHALSRCSGTLSQISCSAPGSQGTLGQISCSAPGGQVSCAGGQVPWSTISSAGLFDEVIQYGLEHGF